MKANYWWNWEVSWISCTFFGAKTEKVLSWSGPIFESFCAGCWNLYWTEDTLYWWSHPKIFKNSRNQLHCETGPALLSDCEDLFFLNGVMMEELHVMTRAEDITAQQILAETNVEVRRELLRKVGVERFLEVAKHEVLNTQENYSLLEIELHPDTPKVRYLKMQNPSIKVWHVEKVNKKCQTVQEAINWRASALLKPGEDWQPAVLT